MKVKTIGLGNIHVNPMVKYLLMLKDDYNHFNPRVARSAQITLHRTVEKSVPDIWQVHWTEWKA